LGIASKNPFIIQTAKGRFIDTYKKTRERILFAKPKNLIKINSGMTMAIGGNILVVRRKKRRFLLCFIWYLLNEYAATDPIKTAIVELTAAAMILLRR
jgi:hypothetical protein